MVRQIITWALWISVFSNPIISFGNPSIDSLFEKGRLLISTNTSAALHHFNQALDLAQGSNDKEMSAQIYYMIARAHWSLDSYVEAMDALNQLESLALSMNADSWLIKSHLGRGNIYLTVELFSIARAYYGRAFELTPDEDSLTRCKILLNIANTHATEGSPDTAIVILENLFLLGKQVMPPPLKLFARQMHIWALTATNQHEQAMELLPAALQHARNSGDKNSEISLLRHNVELLKSHGLYDSALIQGLRAISIAQELESPYQLSETLKPLSTLAAMLDRHEEAFDYLKQHKRLQDSIQDRNALLRLELFEYEKNRNELSQLQAEVTQRKYRNGFLILALGLSVVLIIISLVIQRLIGDKNKKLQAQSEELLLANQKQFKAQDQLIKSEKMALLGRVFSGVGHEFNTPLATIKSNLQLLIDHEQNQYVDLLRKAHRYPKELWDNLIQLLEASKKHNGVMDQRTILRKKEESLNDYFQEKAPAKAAVFTDAFLELQIFDHLGDYEALYRHSQPEDVLEVILSIHAQTVAAETALQGLTQTDHILNTLKAFSFNDSKDRDAIDLIEHLERAFNLYTDRLKKTQVLKQWNSQNCYVKADPEELLQVWAQLLDNAIYANQGEGTIWIRLKENKRSVRVEIEDTGGGIEPSLKSSLFDPFVTNKPETEHSGLGLSMCRRILQKHKGQISARNVKNGALVSVIMPLKPSGI